MNTPWLAVDVLEMRRLEALKRVAGQPESEHSGGFDSNNDRTWKLTLKTVTSHGLLVVWPPLGKPRPGREDFSSNSAK
jgi:hypothetical protein